MWAVNCLKNMIIMNRVIIVYLAGIYLKLPFYVFCSNIKSFVAKPTLNSINYLASHK